MSVETAIHPLLTMRPAISLAVFACLGPTASAQVEMFKLMASDGETWSRFGVSVAISRDRAIVGSYVHDGLGKDHGAAYVFDVTTVSPSAAIGSSLEPTSTVTSAMPPGRRTCSAFPPP